MSNQITITAIYSFIFILLFGIGELLYHSFSIRNELTRKFVHISTGLTCFTFPIFISTHYSVLFLTCSFTFILVLSKRYNILKSINDVNRATLGSYIFPITIYILYLLNSMLGHNNFTFENIEWNSPLTIRGILANKTSIYYFLPLLIFSISDPLAALVGQKWPFGKYKIFNDTKTLIGSSTFFISSFLLASMFFYFQKDTLSDIFLFSILMAFVTAITEGFSQKGMDNLFVPLSAIGVLLFI